MSEKNSNPYDLKTKKDEGYLYEEKPSGYLDSDEMINFLNKRKILIDRTDNLPRFANNNNSLLGRKILKQKKEKILEIFDKSPSAAEYQKRIEAAVGEKDKSKIRDEKNSKCETKTSIARKVSQLLGVNCNRKLVQSVLDDRRSSKIDKLNKKA